MRPKTKGQKLYLEAINSSDITFGIGPAGTGKCVAGNTLVLTQCGLVPIASLADGVALEEQRRKPVRIHGVDGKEWASHVYNGGVKDTLRVTTRHGFQIEGTPEHPLMTLNERGELEWIRLDQLRPGMPLALNRGAQMWGENTQIRFAYQPNPNDRSSNAIQLEELDTDLAYFMGLIVGDGCVTRRGWVLYCSRDESLKAEFASMAARLQLHVTQHGEDQRINSVQFWSLLESLGVKSVKAHEKTVPESILCAPREHVVAFLQGMFDTDGTVSARDGYPSLSSSSETLIRTVQQLLLNLGIVGKLWRKTTTHRDTYTLEMRGVDATRFFTVVGFRLERKQTLSRALKTRQNTNLDLIPNLASSIREVVAAQKVSRSDHKWLHDYKTGRRRPSYPQLHRILKVCHTSSPAKGRLETLVEKHWLWSTVEDITPARAHVYDLTVPGSHSFTAAGFISHNSYLAVAMAVAAFKAKRVKRIILTRPAVEAGERLGFLPGDLQAKIDPYLRPLYDALFDMIDADRFESYLSSGAIEVAPLAFMRGRAQPLHANVLTPLGWRPMGSLEAGDFVIGSDGRPTQVTGIYPQGEKDVYRVTMTDGSSTLTCAEHLWAVKTPSDQRKNKPSRLLETQDMMRSLRVAHQHRFELPLMNAADWAQQPVPLERRRHVPGNVADVVRTTAGVRGLIHRAAEVAGRVERPA
ncbi:MAG: hypothetical protein HC933_07280 [Pleurocapsa sp. SU_196_0]|nr:hypothetical protein [Pleurocapsa sp. SU_196_0]